MLRTLAPPGNPDHVGLLDEMNQQQDVIEYLQEENRTLREHVGDRRLRFTEASFRTWRRRRESIEGIPPEPGN